MVHELGEVPAVLMSGNHARISRWRRQQALGRTWQRRPDLLDEAALSKSDAELLAAYRRETAATQDAAALPTGKPGDGGEGTDS